MKQTIKYHEGEFNKYDKKHKELVQRVEFQTKQINDKNQSNEYKIEKLKEGLLIAKKEKEHFKLSLSEVKNEINDLEFEMGELESKRINTDEDIIKNDEKREKYIQDIKEMKELLNDYVHLK